MANFDLTPTVLVRLIVPDKHRRDWLAGVLAPQAELQVVAGTADLDEVYGGLAMGFTAHLIVVDLHLPRAGQNEFWAVLHQLYPACRLMAITDAAVELAVLETALAAGAAWIGEWGAAPDQLRRLALAAVRGEPPQWVGQPLVVRHAYGHWAQAQPHAGSLHLEPARRAAVVDGCFYRLSPLHYRLIECLYRVSGRMVPVAELLHAGWPHVTIGSASSDQLKTTIHRLRHILEPEPHRPRYLLTLPGGYSLCVAGRPPTDPVH